MANKTNDSGTTTPLIMIEMELKQTYDDFYDILINIG